MCPALGPFEGSLRIRCHALCLTIHTALSPAFCPTPALPCALLSALPCALLSVPPVHCPVPCSPHCLGPCCLCLSVPSLLCSLSHHHTTLCPAVCPTCRALRCVRVLHPFTALCPGLCSRVGETPLHIAAKSGNLAALHKLLQMKDVKADVADRHGWLPIHAAAYAGSEEAVAALVAADGSAVNAKEAVSSARGALHVAVSAGPRCGLAVVERLCSLGAAPAMQDSHLRTPLHVAAEQGCPAAVSFALLRHGGMQLLSVQDHSGATPLHLAVRARHVHQMAALLLCFRSTQPVQPMQPEKSAGDGSDGQEGKVRDEAQGKDKKGRRKERSGAQGKGGRAYAEESGEEWGGGGEAESDGEWADHEEHGSGQGRHRHSRSGRGRGRDGSYGWDGRGSKSGDSSRDSSRGGDGSSDSGDSSRGGSRDSIRDGSRGRDGSRDSSRDGRHGRSKGGQRRGRGGKGIQRTPDTAAVAAAFAATCSDLLDTADASGNTARDVARMVECPHLLVAAVCAAAAAFETATVGAAEHIERRREREWKCRRRWQRAQLWEHARQLRTTAEITNPVKGTGQTPGWASLCDPAADDVRQRALEGRWAQALAERQQWQQEWDARQRQQQGSDAAAVAAGVDQAGLEEVVSGLDRALTPSLQAADGGDGDDLNGESTDEELLVKYAVKGDALWQEKSEGRHGYLFSRWGDRSTLLKSRIARYASGTRSCSLAAAATLDADRLAPWVSNGPFDNVARSVAEAARLCDSRAAAVLLSDGARGFSTMAALGRGGAAQPAPTRAAAAEAAAALAAREAFIDLPPLHVAAMQGDGAADVVSVLLKRGAGVNEVAGVWDATPLTLAARAGGARVCAQLLKAGAQVDPVLSRGALAPLHVAAREGHVNVLQVLLGAGADAQRRACGGATPLMLACGEQRKPAARLLLSHPEVAANAAQARDDAGRTALHHALTDPRALPPALLLSLLAAGCLVTQADNSGHTALHLAAATHHCLPAIRESLVKAAKAELGLTAKTELEQAGGGGKSGGDSVAEGAAAARAAAAAAAAAPARPAGRTHPGVPTAAEVLQLLSAEGAAPGDEKAAAASRVAWLRERRRRLLGEAAASSGGSGGRQDAMDRRGGAVGAERLAWEVSAEDRLFAALVSGSAKAVMQVVRDGEARGLCVREWVSGDAQGSRALHLACRRRRAEAGRAVAQALLAAGEDVDCRDAKGHTPLHLACLMNDSGMVSCHGSCIAYDR